MSNDPLDVTNFLKEKGTTTPPMTVAAEIVRKSDRPPVTVTEEMFVGQFNYSVPSPAARQVEESTVAQKIPRQYTPQDLPVDDSQVPPIGKLTGSGPRTARVPVPASQLGKEVMFRMGPDGEQVGENGKKGPTFNPEQRCHLTIIDTIVHQLPDEASSPVDSRYTRWLTTDEQHFSRQRKIGEKWEPLDTGWIKQCGMLMVKNREGTRRLVNPSVEEQEIEDARIVEVGIDSYHGAHAPGDPVIVFAQILPGESMRIHPHSIGDLRIRCQSGECRISIDAFPE